MKIVKGSFYAGIGSRGTPEDILELMRRIAKKLWSKGMILRSGGANGADLAFQQGATEAEGEMEIYIPWNGFNNMSHGHNNAILVTEPNARLKADNIAGKYHPTYKTLSIGGKKLMQRNTYQILGANFSSFSAVVLCWTKDAADGSTIKTSPASGGTGQAIRIAAANAIPVRNLANPEVLAKWEKWVADETA